MKITAEMKMADLVMMDIQLLSVIQRLEIPLGFREKSVLEVCTEHQVDVNFFLQLANTFHDKDYLKPENYTTFPVDWIVKYLRNSHKGYVDQRIPWIEQLIIEMETDLGKESNLDLLLKFFREYIKEFNTHIGLEEREVFPYVLALSQCLKERTVTALFSERFSNYRIDNYLEEHNDVEEKLFDLKNILIKYMPSPSNSHKYNTLIYELFRMEDDLKDHSDLEDKIFIPKVRGMEKELKKLIKTGQC